MVPVHEQLLDAARLLSEASPNATFTCAEAIRALPHLNQRTVRTHVTSRCCVNAPSNHATRYGYFIRVDRGLYKIEPQYI